MMNQVFFRPGETEDHKEKAERFVHEFKGLIGRSDLLHEWARDRVRQNLEIAGLAGPSVPLREYLLETGRRALVDPRLTREAALLGLLAHYGVEATPEDLTHFRRRIEAWMRSLPSGTRQKLPKQPGSPQQNERSEAGNPWTCVFSRSSLGPETFSVKYTQAQHMRSFSPWAAMPPTWKRIVEICEGLEVPCKETSSGGSPMGHVSCHALDYAFLDGGVFSRGGSYFAGLHGAWVYGTRVLRYLCYALDLRQPKVTTGETGIPSHEDLRREIAVQKETAVVELKERIARSRSVHGRLPTFL
jgi:hypothetical protein